MFTSNNLFQKTSQILTTWHSKVPRQLSQWTTSVINKRTVIILCWCSSHQLESGSDINSWTWLNCRKCSIIRSNIRISWHHGFASKILARMFYFHSVTIANWIDWFSSSTLFTLKAVPGLMHFVVISNMHNIFIKNSVRIKTAWCCEMLCQFCQWRLCVFQHSWPWNFVQWAS